MGSWLNRLRNRQNWVSFAVRLGLDAFARECVVGRDPLDEAGAALDSLPGAAGAARLEARMEAPRDPA